MKATRSGFLILTLAVLTSFSLAACSKSSQSPIVPDSTQRSDSSSGPGTSSFSTTETHAQPNPAPPAQPVSVTVHAGTDLHVVLDQSISSATAHTGDSFTATLVVPVRVGGRVVIPRDARVVGHLADARASGRLSGVARLVLTLDSVEINGKRVDIQTSSIVRSGKAHKKRDVIAIGGGSALGAIVGAIAGGGKGAAIGAAAGAGAGTAGAALTGELNIVLPAEDRLLFRLEAPISVGE